MRSNITSLLNSNHDYWLFLRQNPMWHQILSRHPERINQFMNEYKIKRRKRFIDKVEDATMMLDLVSKVMGE
ncbi:MAG: hypothetical protein E7184_01575 [Erysipelotrichaceae bacterium]|nr:hypothetical protein [Erysipelotrichaceae bacterium]